MQKLKQRMYKDGSTAAFRMKGVHKFQDIRTKLISFINRNLEQLRIALEMLRKRYKTVVLNKKLINGWYQGSFEVTL